MDLCPAEPSPDSSLSYRYNDSRHSISGKVPASTLLSYPPSLSFPKGDTSRDTHLGYPRGNIQKIDTLSLECYALEMRSLAGFSKTSILKNHADILTSDTHLKERKYIQRFRCGYIQRDMLCVRRCYA
nr:hypothetical protein Q903MT_gene6523 [Picea sitchensis]